MSEMVQLVDEDGNFQRAVERDEVDEYPDSQMVIVELVLMNSVGEFLYHERHPSKSEAGKIDHVCGAVREGETPEEAARREALEEVELEVGELKEVARGVNEYGRYRMLFVGEFDQVPTLSPTNEEASYVAKATLDELQAIQTAGQLFVNSFFSSIDQAVSI